MLLSLSAQSADLYVQLKDKNGKAFPNAVVYATAQFALSGNYPPAPNEMLQVNKQFEPHILVVQKGADVSFPNKDTIKHHVYSFSPTKSFELALYKDTPVTPVGFDKVGDVEMGCNVHDWMLGYIKVVDTPFFGKTDLDGRTKLPALPTGSYKLMVWHPRTGDEEAGPQSTLTVAADDMQFNYQLDVDVNEALNDYEEFDQDADY